VNTNIFVNDIHGTDLQILSATVNGAPITISPDNKQLILTPANYGSDGILIKGECVNIVETIKAVNCGDANGGMASTINGFIDGCNNVPDIVSNSLNVNVIMGGTPPNLVATTSQVGLDSLCPTTPRFQIYTVKNMGQDTARNLTFDLISNGFLRYIGGSISVTINGVAVTATQQGTTTFAGGATAATCLGAGAVNNGTWSLPPLATGQVMVIQYQLASCCTAPNCQNYVATSNPRLRYNKLCPNANVIVTDLLGVNASVTYQTPIADYPASVKGGECFNIEIINNLVNLPSARQNSLVEFEIGVPTGITPTTNEFITSSNITIPPVSTSFSGGKLKLTYRYGDIKNLSYATWSLDFCTTACPNCTEGLKDFPIKITLKADPACAGCNGTNLYCGSPAKVYVHCDGCGISCDGLEFRGYDMKRVSRCQADNNNDRKPDATYGNTSFLKLRRAMYGDTVQTSFSGIIRTTPTHPSWTYIYAQDSIPNVAGTNTPVFTPVAGDMVMIYRNKVLVCSKIINATSSMITGKTVYTRDLSATTLACAGITNYQNGDSLFIKGRYYVSGNVGDKLEILTTKPGFYATLSPNNATRYSCDYWENNFTIGGYVQEINGFNNSPTGTTDVTCAGSGPGIIFRANYAGTSNPFPYEFRNFSIPSEFTITVPVGFTMQSLNATFNYNGGSVTVLPNILAQGVVTTLPSGDKKLTFNLTTLFSNTVPTPAGKLPFPDESYTLTLTPEYEISTEPCQSSPKGVTLTGKFENNCVIEKILAYSNTISDNLSNLKYKAPTFNPMPVGISRYKYENEECFEFTPVLEDVAGTNYFFRIQANSNIQITRVLANDVLISPSASDATLYYVGSKTAYKICMTYTNCVSTEMINIDLGYQCSSTPPATFAAIICPTTPIQLKLLPNPTPASIQISPTPLSYIPNMCEPIEFAVIVKNSGVSTLYDPKFKINLPPFLDIVPGSSKITWHNQNDVTIPDPTIIGNAATPNPNDKIATYNLNALGGLVDSLKYGLDGSGVGAPVQDREYEITYKVIAKCGFKANTGATYDVSFRDPCEVPLVTKAFASKIPINITNPYAATATISGILDAVPSCGTPTPVSINLKNNGAGLTSANDSIYVTMPNTAYIVPNSFINAQNLASPTPQKQFLPPSDTIYRWKVAPNMAVGADAKIDFKILATASAPCGLKDTFTVEMISWRNAPCVLTGGTCSLPVSVALQDGCFTVKKPSVAFVAGTLTNLVMGTMSIISVAVKNTSDIPLEAKLANIKIYYDVDNSQTVTASDQLLSSAQFIPALDAGAVKYYYVKINTALGKCPIVAQIGGGCVCGSSIQATSLCNTNPYCAPAPSFNLPSAICEGGVADFTANATDTLNYKYTWQIYGANVVNGATTSTNPTNLTGTGPFSIKWNTAGTYSIKLKSELKVFPTCRDSINQFFTVNPIPTMNQPANITVECENQLIDVTDFVGNPNDNNMVFAWLNNNTALGLAASGTGQIATYSAPNNTTGSDRTATITVMPSRLGCVGVAKTFTITQKPTPLVNTPPNLSVCPNDLIDPADFVSTPSGAAFSWTNNSTVIGLGTTGNGQITPYNAPVNNTAANFTGTITGKATFPVSALGNTCTSSRTFTIAVKPTPLVTQPADIAKCPGETISVGNFIATPATSTTFAWTNSNTAIGLSSSGTTNIANYTAPTNNTTSDIIGNLTVTPTRLSCVGLTKNFTITVKPTPVLNQPNNVIVCPNENINPDDFTSSLAGTTYMWTNNNTSIGLAASGTGQISDFLGQNTTTITQIATITVTGTAPNNCKLTKTFTLSVKPKPALTNATAVSYCPDDAAVINWVSTVPSTTITWFNSNPSIGLATTNGNGNIAFTATNSTNAPILSNIVATPTANACVGTATTIIVTVKPKPILDPIASFIVCPNTSVAVSNFATNPTGSTFMWSNSNPSIGLIASGTGQIPSFNAAANNTNANVTGTISVTPTLNGCVGNTNTMSVTVKPTPTVNAIGNNIVCPDQLINIDNFSSTPLGGTFAWTNDNTATGLAALNGNGQLPDFTSAANNTGANIVSNINVTTTLNGCLSPNRAFTITVRPTPMFTPIADVMACSGDLLNFPNFASTPVGATFAWVNSNTAIGKSVSGNGQIADYNAPQNFTAANIEGTILVTPTLNSCVGPVETFKVIIKPRPTLNQPADITVCKDETVNVDDFLSNIPNTTFAWTNNNTAIGLGANGTGQIVDFVAQNNTTFFQTSTIKVTATAPNGCTFEKIFQITVKPKPSVTGFSNQLKCPNEVININFGTNINASTFAWTNDNSSIGLAASGNGDISFTTTNTTNLVKMATITVTPSSNSCSNAAQTFTITVKPTPILNNLSDVIVCPTAPIDVTNFASNPTGATFAWQNSNPQVGIAASGNGDIATYNAPTNTSGNNYTSRVTVTPSLNGCVGASEGFDLTVKPTPTINQPQNIIVCPTESIDFEAFITNVTGETYSWTNDNTAIGLAASGNGQLVNYTAPANATNSNIVGNISFKISAAGCDSPTKMFSVTIKPTPTMNNPSDVIVCPNEQINVTNFVSTPTGASFAWTNDNSDIGIADNGVGDIATYTAPANHTFANVVGNVVITPTLNGCAGTTQDAIITIKPTPEVNQPSDIIVCPGQVINVDDFVSNPTGGTFDWTNTNTNIGIAASGTGQIATYNAPPNMNGANFASLIKVKTTLNTCVGPIQEFAIVVKPMPQVAAIPPVMVCAGELIDLENFDSNVANSSFSWTNTNTNIGLKAAGTGQIIDYSAPQNTTGASIVGTIAYKAIAEGCASATQTTTVTIYPTPLLNDIPNLRVCAGELIDPTDFNIIPSGSTFVWMNNNTDIGLAASGIDQQIAPFIAPPNNSLADATAEITYRASKNGCLSEEKAFSITIKPTPIMNDPKDLVVCAGEVFDMDDFKSTPLGSTFAWINDNTATNLAASGNGQIANFNAPTTGAANITSHVTITPTLEGCVGVAQMTDLTVLFTPLVNAVSNISVCPGEPLDIDFIGTASTTFTWLNDNPAVGLTATGSGRITPYPAPNTGTTPIVAHLAVTPSANTCIGGTENFTITIKPTPTVNALADQTVCPTENVTYNFSGALLGTNFLWTNYNQENLNIGLPTAGDGNINFTTTPNNTLSYISSKITVTPRLDNCNGASVTAIINVKPTPTINQPNDIIVCAGEEIDVEDFESNLDGATFSWTNDNPSIGLAASGTGQIANFNAAANNTGINQVANITLFSSKENCNSVTKTFKITIKPTPTVNDPSDILVCPNDLITIGNFVSTPAGGSFMWTNDNDKILLSATGSGLIAPYNAPANATGQNIVATMTVKTTLNGCVSPAQEFTITVKPTPKMIDPQDIYVCPGEIVNAETFISLPAGANYSWTNDNLATNLAGNGTGQLPNFTAPVNGLGVDIISNVTVTPLLGGCVGEQQMFKLGVKFTPFVGQPTDIVACPGENIEVDFVGTVATTFSWTNTNAAVGIPLLGIGRILPYNAPPNNTGIEQISILTVTPTANSCIGGTQQFKITVKPTPTVNDPQDVVVCPDMVISMTFQGSHPASTYTWTNSNNDYGLASTGDGKNINFTAAMNTTPSNLIGNIVVTPHLNGCDGLTQTATITVKPTPKAIIPSDIRVCQGELISIPNFMSTPLGASFVWENNNTAIGIAQSGVGNIASYNAPTHLMPIDMQAEISIKPTLNSCVGEVQTFNVAIKPSPTMTIPFPITVCPKEFVEINDFKSIPTGASYTWTNDNTTIGLGANGVGMINSFTVPDMNLTGMDIIANVQVTPSVEGCIGTPEIFKIKIKGTPTVQDPICYEVCPGELLDIDFVGSPGAKFVWTNDNPLVGLGTGGTGSIKAYKAPMNNTTDTLLAHLMVTPIADNCIGAPEQFLIAVKPTPVVTEPMDLEVCPLDSIKINFSSNLENSTLIWTNSNTADGLPSSGVGKIRDIAPMNKTGKWIHGDLTVQPLKNRCFGAIKTFSLDIKPTPAINMPMDLLVCSGSETNVDLFVGNPAGGTFQWTSSNPNINLPASDVGQIYTYFAPLNTTAANITSNIVWHQLLDGCYSRNDTFKITVKPFVGLSKVMAVTVCPDENVAIDALMSTIPANYVWRNTNLSIGLDSVGTGQVPNFIGKNIGTKDNVAHIYVQPKANDCTGDLIDIIVTVKPKPKIDALPDLVVCPSEAIEIAFKGNLENNEFTWSNDNTNTGLGNLGSGQIPIFNAFVNGSAVNNVSNIVWFSNVNDCLSKLDTFIITVKPTPTISQPTDAIACPTEQIALDNFTATPSGSLINWSNTNPNIGITASGTGQIAPYNAPTNNSDTTMFATILLQSERLGCKSDVKEVTVKVKPTPKINSIDDIYACPGELVSLDPFVSNLPSANIIWTNYNSSYLPLANVGNGQIPFFQLPKNATGADVVSILTVLAEAQTCISKIDTFKVIVRPTPVFDKIPNVEVCPNEPISVTFSGTPSGAGFYWKNDNTAVGIAADGTGNIPTYNAPANNTLSDFNASIKTAIGLNGCFGDTLKTTIRIKPTPSVAKANDISICSATDTIRLNFVPNLANTAIAWTNSNPKIGLSATGNGKIKFPTPSNLTDTIMSATIRYTPTLNACAGSEQATVLQIKPRVTMNAVDSVFACAGDVAVIPAFNSSPLGATFTWNNNKTSIGLANFGTGQIENFVALNTDTVIVAKITVFATLGGCGSSSRDFYIKVKPRPRMNPPLDLFVCAGEAVRMEGFTSNIPSVSYTWNNDNPALNLLPNGKDSIVFTAPIVPPSDPTARIMITPTLNGCVGASRFFSITERPITQLDSLPDYEICLGQPLNINFTSKNPDIIIDWTNNNTTFGIPQSGTGDFSFIADLPEDTNGDPILPLNNIATITATPIHFGCPGKPMVFKIRLVGKAVLCAPKMEVIRR
jgi:hypothetical protein